MSRRKAATKREILPDSKYGNLVVAKCINVVMWDGKKEVAENIVYGALDKLKTLAKDGKDELTLFLGHPVHGCATIVHFTNLVCPTCIEQNTFRSCCFTRINMGHNANIAVHM